MLAKNYDEGAEDGTSFTRNLNDLTFGAALAKVRKKRDKKKADLVSLIRDKNPSAGICGIGWVSETPPPLPRILVSRSPGGASACRPPFPTRPATTWA